MMMNCALQPPGNATGIIVDTDIQLLDTITQFDRTRLFAEIANAGTCFPAQLIIQSRDV